MSLSTNIRHAPKLQSIDNAFLLRLTRTTGVLFIPPHYWHRPILRHSKKSVSCMFRNVTFLKVATFTSLWQNALRNHISELFQSHVGIVTSILRVMDINTILWLRAAKEQGGNNYSLNATQVRYLLHNCTSIMLSFTLWKAGTGS